MQEREQQDLRLVTLLGPVDEVPGVPGLSLHWQFKPTKTRVLVGFKGALSKGW